MFSRSRIGLIALAATLVVSTCNFGTILAQATSVQYDKAYSADTGPSGASSLTWRHDVLNEGNRYLAVLVSIKGTYGGDGIQVQSVSFNGKPGTRHTAGDANEVRTELWGVYAPDPGAHDVVVTLADGQSVRFVAASISLWNVHQTDAALSNGSFKGTSNTATKGLETASDNVLVSVVSVPGTIGTSGNEVWAGSGQTEEWERFTGSAATDARGAGGWMPGVVGSFETRWLLSSSQNWAISALSIQPPYPPTLAKLRKTEATLGQDGVLINWRTGYEIDNLGFNVYREARVGLEQLNPSLIAGSSLLAGGRTELRAGHSYSWQDPRGTSDSRYWLEDIDRSGLSQMHGPIFVEGGSTRAQSSPASAVLHALGDTGRDLAPSRSETVPISLKMVTHTSMQELQWRLAADGNALRINISEPGWYRLSSAGLEAQGFTHGKDLRDLRLYYGGQQVPLLLGSDSNGKARPGANTARWSRREKAGFVEFFAAGVDTPYTADSIYWLVRDPATPALRLQRSSEASGVPGPDEFLSTVEKKERLLYFGALRDDNRDNFFGRIVNDSPQQQTLVLPLVRRDSAQPSQLEVALQGVSAGLHKVNVSFNGVALGRIEFADEEYKIAKFEIGSSLLTEGENQVTLTAPDNGTDVSLIDYIRIRYPRPYVSNQNLLYCTAPAGTDIRIDGFTHPDIRVIDVTDPLQVIELMGTVGQTDAGYSIRVSPLGGSSSVERQLFAFTPESILKPQIKVNQASSWNAESNRADLVIITHGGFAEPAARLADLRQSAGYTTAVVEVKDLYDEFTYGIKDPTAIQAFLTRATSEWQFSPRFAILFGDASNDPRNYLGLGANDLVPTRLVSANLLKTSSDDWFVRRIDSPVALGRLPVRSLEEANLVVNKLIAYEQRPEHEEAWTGKATLLADVNSPPFFSFEDASAAFGQLLAPVVQCKQILVRELGVEAARAQVFEAFNNGMLLMNLVGHGSVDVWGNGGLLDKDDIANLNNGDRLPLVVTLNCLNGFFHDAGMESMAEALLKAESGGAVAVLASSALTDPSGQAALATRFYEELFKGSGTTLGEALVKAKRMITDEEVKQTFMLFGDPTLRLR